MLTEERKKELNNCELLNSSCADMAQSNHINSTISVKKSQSLENEMNEKFTPKKELSELLIMSYLRLGYDKKAESVANCANYLEFAKFQDDTYKLHKANFCRDRLCPMCAWRRSRKIFGQVSQVMNLIEKDYAFIFVTLTVPNCHDEDLSQTIDDMNRAWRKYIKYKRISKICKGFFKTLEITYNKESDSYHPHFHIIIAVPKSYFKKEDYIPHSEWLNLWRKAMKNQKITQVDVRKIRPKNATASGADCSNVFQTIGGAVAEVAKYAVKSSSYLFKSNELLTDWCVSTFTTALYNRRLVAMGGCFLDAHNKLNLDDSEDGDLIHLDGDIRSDVAIMILRFGWSCGVYKLVEVVDKSLDPENILAEYEEE